MTLPLSYSRLRGSLLSPLRRRRLASLRRSLRSSGRSPALSSPHPPLRIRLDPPGLPARLEGEAKVGGEGRTRTFEAARATDLQSAAFDRFATSPTVCLVESVCSTLTGCYLDAPLKSMELAKGFEPPTG